MINYAVNCPNHCLLLSIIIDTRPFDRLKRHNHVISPKVRQERWLFAAYCCNNLEPFGATSKRLAADIDIIMIASQLEIELLVAKVFVIELVFEIWLAA